MTLKRMLLVGLVAGFLVVTGCSSSKKDAAKATVSSVLASTTTTEASAGGGEGSTTTVGSGSSTDGCAAFLQVQNIATVVATSGGNSGTAADKVHQIADDIRSSAPASVSTAAGAYADKLDAVADAIGTNGFSAAVAAQVGSAATAADSLPYFSWAAQNCK